MCPNQGFSKKANSYSMNPPSPLDVALTSKSPSFLADRRVSELRSTKECQPNSWRVSNDLYTPLSFLVFNVGDFTGRVLAGNIPAERIGNMSLKLVLSACLRCVFMVLFLFCVVDASVAGGNSDDDGQGKRLLTIQSDFYSFTIQLLFAMSNGLVISTSFMYASIKVDSTTDMQERSSEILTFAIAFGLLSGSLLSFPFTNLAKVIT